MEGKKINSQVIDLQKEPCPMNLVKFKFHFHELKTFTCTVMRGEASDGIINFLRYKKANFEFTYEGEKCTITIQ